MPTISIPYIQIGIFGNPDDNCLKNFGAKIGSTIARLRKIENVISIK
jgi:hypothetical protein